MVKFSLLPAPGGRRGEGGKLRNTVPVKRAGPEPPQNYVAREARRYASLCAFASLISAR